MEWAPAQISAARASEGPSGLWLWLRENYPFKILCLAPGRHWPWPCQGLLCLLLSCKNPGSSMHVLSIKLKSISPCGFLVHGRQAEVGWMRLVSRFSYIEPPPTLPLTGYSINPQNHPAKQDQMQDHMSQKRSDLGYLRLFKSMINNQGLLCYKFS